MNRSPLVLILTVIGVSLLSGCEALSGLNPFASEAPLESPAPAAPTDPNAPPPVAPAAAPNVPPSATPFRDAVNKAMAAATAVQTAKTPAEWQTVVTTWQEAIALMQQVPQSDPNYAVAQQKVAEYTGYLQYAQKNAAPPQ